MLRSGQTRLRLRFAVMLVTFALAMRMLVPEGFMLAPGGGMPNLMLCDGMAPAPSHAAMAGAMAGMHHGSGKQDGPSAPERPCAFSAAAFAADTVAPIVIAPLAPPRPVPAAVRVFDVRPGAGLAAPPPWQTGPPAIA